MRNPQVYPSIQKLQILNCRNCQEVPVPSPSVTEGLLQRGLGEIPLSLSLNSTWPGSKCSMGCCSSGQHPIQAPTPMPVSPSSRNPRHFPENTGDHPLLGKALSLVVLPRSPTYSQHGFHLPRTSTHTFQLLTPYNTTLHICQVPAALSVLHSACKGRALALWASDVKRTRNNI